MDKHSYKKFLVYLVNFRSNYKYFAVSHSGKYLALYLDQFIKDQIKTARIIYGDHGAMVVQEVAQKLSQNGRRARSKDQLTQACQ